jgi:TRAP-type mannitol/chloroaromatic compound transport system permease small subunit
MKKIIQILDTITHITATSTAWLIPLMVLTTCAVVILRKFFDFNLISMQESVIYMHAVVFMLATAWALQRGAHVRVDIFYQGFSKSTQAWINIIGSLLFTIPVMAFIGFISWDFVCESWRIREKSSAPDGLAFVFLLKSLIPLMALSVCVQTLAEIARNTCFLMSSSSEQDSTTC